MALVTFEDYTGNKVEINPATVISVSTYEHYDHDLELPEELMIKNANGLSEVNPEKRDEADKMRTSLRTIVSFTGGSTVVQGTVAQVKKALA